MTPEISGYEILGNLGEGGMGAVHLARQISLSRYVAIKTLPPHLARDESYVKRFRLEAQAAASLKHSGIVQIYDAGEDNGTYFFVMEFANGETVGQRVRRKGVIDEETTLLVGESVAVALEYAWDQAKLVHRDVKPDNILIDEDGTVKVTDLGLAKTLDSAGPAITVNKMVMGTPYYCSPEQARGDPDVDFRADIYALGATMYHLVTGTAPFSDNPGVSAMVRHITDYLTDPMDINPDVSENFGWLLEKMMAKDPAHRQSSWREILDDIDRVLSGLSPLSARLDPGLSTIERSPRRAAKKKSKRAKRKRRPVQLSPEDTVTVVRTGKERKRAFHLFLVSVTILTIVLYIVWFKMEERRRKLIEAERNATREKIIPVGAVPDAGQLDRSKKFPGDPGARAGEPEEDVDYEFPEPLDVN